ncbi:hypothetical protein LZC95_07765 [Pendulispora brunnea]|uniref:Uncharacterized protein n=1 Tax=Pendulispora brunnea TaxID=2905690 RepID=A0ABZ2KDQ0_9BACT
MPAVTSHQRDPKESELRAAEAELIEYFGSALGVRAQSYDGSAGVFDSSLLTSMGELPAAHRRLRHHGHRQHLAIHGKVARTLAVVSGFARNTLLRTYGPQDCSPRGALVRLRLRIGPEGPRGEARYSLLRVALGTHALRQAWNKKHDGDPTRDELVDLLEQLAGRPGGEIAGVRTEAEGVYQLAIAEYVFARRARLEEERREAAVAAAARAEYLDSLRRGRTRWIASRG